MTDINERQYNELEKLFGPGSAQRRGNGTEMVTTFFLHPASLSVHSARGKLAVEPSLGLAE